MSYINGMRRPMMTGVRRSAKQVVADFIGSAIKVMEDQERCPPALVTDLKTQLRAYRALAQELGWRDLEKRIDRAFNPKSVAPELTQEQLDAHSWAQANDSDPKYYKPPTS